MDKIGFAERIALLKKVPFRFECWTREKVCKIYVARQVFTCSLNVGLFEVNKVCKIYVAETVYDRLFLNVGLYESYKSIYFHFSEENVLPKNDEIVLTR